ncbi:hypothetical protein LTS17_004244 [Exophiala oligosperma]
MATMTDQVCRFIYPVKTPNRPPRPANYPMQVLALGLPRSGTDSLKLGLEKLGYHDIWHGFNLPSSRANDCPLWLQLLQAKERGDQRLVEGFDWDRLLAECDGIMDMPPLLFAEELLDFYPHAAVILNRRRDMNAWHRSLNEAVEMTIGSWIFWVLSRWDARMYWWYRTVVLSISMMGKGPGGFQQNGKQWAEDYYQNLESKLNNEERNYLKWEVQQGWEPLCKFLDKPVPDEEFPWENKAGAEFQKKVEAAGIRMAIRAFRNMVIAGVIVGGSLAWWWESA